MKITKKELLTLVSQAEFQAAAEARDLKGSGNIITQNCYWQARGKVDAFAAMQRALRGDAVKLQVYAGPPLF